MKSSHLATIFAFFICLQAAAQSMPDSQISEKAASTKVVYIDGRPESETLRQNDIDSIRRKVTMFYYDQFRHFMDPDAPYFLFMSKDNNFSMGIGGGVRMRAYYDWGGAVPSSAFAPYTIPIPADPARMRHFATVPSGTYLFFRVIGNNSVFGEYQLYIESDFTGYQGRDFKLKKAYATVHDFTFGYAASTFSDPAALSPVVDAAGPNNKFSATSVLVRYMPQFKQHWYVGVSVETPSTMVAADNQNTRPVSEWLPDFAALVQYEWQQGQHVRLSGIVRSLSYRDMVTSTNHNLAGWGVQLSSEAHPHNRITTYLTANYGKGYAGLGSDLLYGAYDLVATPDDPTKLYAPASYGWNLGVQYNFRPNLFATISASETRFLPKDGTNPDEYKYGIFGCANVFWSILPRVTVAAELDYGYRRNISGVGRAAHRANVMASFTF